MMVFKLHRLGARYFISTVDNFLTGAVSMYMHLSSIGSPLPNVIMSKITQHKNRQQKSCLSLISLLSNQQDFEKGKIDGSSTIPCPQLSLYSAMVHLNILFPARFLTLFEFIKEYGLSLRGEERKGGGKRCIGDEAEQNKEEQEWRGGVEGRRNG